MKPPVDNEETIGDRVKRARLALGWGAPKVAKAIPMSTAALQELERGESRGTKHLLQLARVLGQDPEWLESGKGQMREPGADTPQPSAVRSDVGPALHAGDLSSVGTWPKDVPVMGVTVGGSSDNSFILNMGDVVDFARRPPTLGRSSKVFALYVQGESMMTWRAPGGLVYLDPVRPAKPGDRVVVEFKEEAGDGVIALLKELVATTPTKLKLRQYNPDRVIEISRGQVKNVRRVIEWEELLQI